MTTQTGEWLTEPDEDRFEAHGLKCVIKRVDHSGHLCGYVAVPPTHPLFGKDYSATVIAPKHLYERKIDVDEVGALNLLIGAMRADAATDEKVKTADLCVLIDCHGGLTWAADCAAGDDPDGNWWFGFDCAHVDDFCPKHSTRFQRGIYRNIIYVRNICNMLAE